MSQDRTEAPTQRRLRQLASHGTTARSQDITGALALLAAVIGIQQVVPTALAKGVSGLRSSLISSSQADITFESLSNTWQPMLPSAFTMLAGVIAPVLVVSLAVGLFQIRGRLAFSAIVPNPGRLNPIAGAGRIFGTQGLFNLIWSLVKVSCVAFAVQGPARGILTKLPTAVAGGIGAPFQVLGSASFEAGRNGAIALVLISLGDVIYRRMQFMGQARMTKREVRDDIRETDGDPAIRARIRAQQRRMARSRMMARVAEAQVVVVNPTHFAVALAYDARSMAAPEVVAKGADLIAQRIIEIAKENRVPVVPNPPLARAMYRSVEIGEPIPVALYQAIAEVLAYVYSSRRRR